MNIITENNKIWQKYLEEKVYDEYHNDFEAAMNNSDELQTAIDLMKDIKSRFPRGEIYIVGGVARDILMGEPIDDVDLATNIPFDKLKEIYPIRNISKNDSQPVYAIQWKNYTFDLAKFREDSVNTQRKNNVSKETDDFSTDTKRRDITINAFGIDENGVITDHQNGMEDIKNKIIRAVGDPKTRFMEDATRILRVFRFAAKMGFDIDPNTLNAAKELKNILNDSSAISKESISKEFYKSAKSGKTLARFIQYLMDSHILHQILPEFTDMQDFKHNPKHHPEGESTVIGHILEALKASPYSDPVINLAVLFHDLGKATTKGEKDGQPTYYGHESAGVPIAKKIFERLRFSELSAQDKQNILVAVNDHMKIHNLQSMNPKNVVKMVLDPSWNTLKSVAYCDEASRGSIFDKQKFQEKIEWAESLANSMGSSNDDLRKKIKSFYDGNKLKKLLPHLKNKEFGETMSKINDFIQDKLLNNISPSQEDIEEFALSVAPPKTESYKNDNIKIWESYISSQHDNYKYNL